VFKKKLWKIGRDHIKPRVVVSVFLSEPSRKTADIIFASEHESICGNWLEPVLELQHCVTKYVIVLRQQAAALKFLHI
jgi:hypothetical protein